MATYLSGNQITLTATFQVSNTNTDPTTILLEIQHPNKAVDSFTYASGALTKTATGVYTYTLTLAEVGHYKYRWTGAGTVVAKAESGFDITAPPPWT